MKGHLLVILVLATAVLAQGQLMSSFMDFTEGFILGLHLERLAPTVYPCMDTYSIASKAISQAIAARREGQPYYNYMNNMTLALEKVPIVCRTCVKIPPEMWHNIEEIYMKKFEYSWSRYFHAVFLNIGARLDEIIYNFLKAESAMRNKDYFTGGHYYGTACNIIFNVTSDVPPPPPPPKPDYDNVLPVYETEAVGSFHDDFRKYFNYTMITLYYTRWINGTTAANMYSSVMNIEMKIHNALILFSDPKKPDTLEGILTLIDTLEYSNAFFNGIYFTLEQLPQHIFKNLIFEHFNYVVLNSILNMGYYIWDGIKLSRAEKNHNDLEICRRTAILVRKVFYFDQDLLDEVYNNIPSFIKI